MPLQTRTKRQSWLIFEGKMQEPLTLEDPLHSQIHLTHCLGNYHYPKALIIQIILNICQKKSLQPIHMIQQTQTYHHPPKLKSPCRKPTRPPPLHPWFIPLRSKPPLPKIAHCSPPSLLLLLLPNPPFQIHPSPKSVLASLANLSNIQQGCRPWGQVINLSSPPSCSLQPKAQSHHFHQVLGAQCHQRQIHKLLPHSTKLSNPTSYYQFSTKLPSNPSSRHHSTKLSNPATKLSNHQFHSQAFNSHHLHHQLIHYLLLPTTFQCHFQEVIHQSSQPPIICKLYPKWGHNPHSLVKPHKPLDPFPKLHNHLITYLHKAIYLAHSELMFLNPNLKSDINSKPRSTCSNMHHLPLNNLSSTMQLPKQCTIPISKSLTAIRIQWPHRAHTYLKALLHWGHPSHHLSIQNGSK